MLYGNYERSTGWINWSESYDHHRSLRNHLFRHRLWPSLLLDRFLHRKASRMIPTLGQKIKYQKKGTGPWHEATVTCIWCYDSENICDLDDGQHLIVAFGDEWYDA